MWCSHLRARGPAAINLGSGPARSSMPRRFPRLSVPRVSKVLRGEGERAMLTAQNWIMSAMGITVCEGLGGRREREERGMASISDPVVW